jgi:hypothetical protein
MSEADVTVARIEIYDFIASKMCIVQGTVKQESRKDSIVQNCSVKKQLQAGKMLQCRTALWRNRKEWHSCQNILIQPLLYATLYSLLIKIKLNPFINIKIVLGTAFSKTVLKMV